MSRSSVCCCLAAVVLVAAAGVRGSIVAQEPVKAAELDAESVSLDFETRTAVFERIRITDGNMSVLAGEARRVGAGEADEAWSLAGDVVVTVASATARADTATLRFSSGRLVFGELVGEPVELETPGEDPFRGTADRIAYDGVADLFSATGNASFSMGAQEVRCDWVYDVNARRAVGSPNREQRCSFALPRRQL